MGDEKSCLNCGAARADGSCEHFTGNHDWCGDERRYWVPIASRSPHDELRARVVELEGEVERVRTFWESECKRIADERDALNVEIVAQARSMAVERGLLSRCERPDVVAALRLQLKQLRAEVERLTRELRAATAADDVHEAHHILAGLEAADTTNCTADCSLRSRPPMKQTNGKER